MARTYTVKSGDNLARIAEQFYGGDQRMLALLVRANGGSTVIRPGDVIRIPNISQAEQRNFNISQGGWNAITGQNRPAPTSGAAGGFRNAASPSPRPAGYNYFQQYVNPAPTTTSFPDSPGPLGSNPPPPTTTSSPLGSGPIGGSQYYNQYVNPQPAPTGGGSRRGNPRPSSTASGTLRSGRQAQRSGSLIKPSRPSPVWQNTSYGQSIRDATQVGREESSRVATRETFRPTQAGYNVSPDLRRATAGSPRVSPGGQGNERPQFDSYDDAFAYVENLANELDTVGRSPVSQIIGVQRDASGNPIFRDGRPVYTYRQQAPDVGESETFRGPYVGIDWSFPPWDPRHRFLGGAPELGYPDYMTPGYRSDWARIPEMPAGPTGGGGGYGGGYGGYTPPARTTYAPGGYTRQGESPDVAPGRPRGQYGYGGGGGGGAVPFRMPGGAGAQRSGVTALVSWTL